jgi:hypothetical protein
MDERDGKWNNRPTPDPNRNPSQPKNCHTLPGRSLKKYKVGLVRFFMQGFKITSLSFAAACLTVNLQALPSQAITTWNWNFTTASVNPDQFGSGTFTTADVTPTAFTTYSILDIDGTYSRNGITYNITGLDSFGGVSNRLQWDGTVLSAILSDNSGISFSLDSSTEVNIYFNNAVFNAVNFVSTPFDSLNIVSSSLTPVPGPLPLFGAATAYSWSRRMRRRIAEKA